jgi:hypothetical protein
MLKVIDQLSVVFNCFCGGKKNMKNAKNEDDIVKIQKLSTKYNISILPIKNFFELESLYPVTNQVHTWSTFIIGKDKTYVLANGYNFDLGAPAEELLNKKAPGHMNENLVEFFEPIWKRTLKEQQLQFFMVYCGITYLVNTYALRNESHKIIGACMFIRTFDSMPSVTSRLTTHKE